MLQNTNKNGPLSPETESYQSTNRNMSQNVIIKRVSEKTRVIFNEQNILNIPSIPGSNTS